jgi:hypothetical protein
MKNHEAREELIKQHFNRLYLKNGDNTIECFIYTYYLFPLWFAPLAMAP